MKILFWSLFVSFVFLMNFNELVIIYLVGVALRIINLLLRVYSGDRDVPLVQNVAMTGALTSVTLTNFRNLLMNVLEA
ncbi:hypothetical protein Anas_12102 [Armadillidium nasatum]|uniref:Uncharacterized protein n=1 Tax=Armadillidium nasatum TaxID=96803 RepID=A0A5N5SRE0_9CRUS|nr:hypothetical protein Anas_12102 [Armadillidium nasatum]